MTWIDRIWRHNRDDEGDFGSRAALHIPVGMLMGIPVLGWQMIPLFLEYERNEDNHTTDEAWKDIFGAMVGFATMTLSLTAGAVLLAWRYL